MSKVFYMFVGPDHGHMEGDTITIHSDPPVQARVVLARYEGVFVTVIEEKGKWQSFKKYLARLVKDARGLLTRMHAYLRQAFASTGR